MKRRHFLKTSLLSAGVAAAWPHAAASAADPVPKSNDPNAEGLTAYLVDGQVWIRWNNHVLTCYRAHQSQKYPYFYPLAGPASGLSLTSESSQPWPHHRSLMFACDKVNGGNYWQGDLAAGQIVSTKLALGECTKNSAEIIDHCQWRRPGEDPVMTDTRCFRVHVPGDGAWFMDAEIQWTAQTDVTIQKTNHSLFAVRAAIDIAPDGGGKLMTSAGRFGADQTFGKPAHWCTFYGPRKQLGQEYTEGIAIMQYPKPWPECPWFTRDYGFMSPTPMNFLDAPMKIPAGETIKLVYRVVAYRGTPGDANLEAFWKSFADNVDY